MSVDTAPEGEEIARENWSKHEQKPRRTHSLPLDPAPLMPHETIW